MQSKIPTIQENMLDDAKQISSDEMLPPKSAGTIYQVLTQLFLELERKDREKRKEMHEEMLKMEQELSDRMTKRMHDTEIKIQEEIDKSNFEIDQLDVDSTDDAMKIDELDENEEQSNESDSEEEGVEQGPVEDDSEEIQRLEERISELETENCSLRNQIHSLWELFISFFDNKFKALGKNLNAFFYRSKDESSNSSDYGKANKPN